LNPFPKRPKSKEDIPIIEPTEQFAGMPPAGRTHTIKPRNEETHSYITIKGSKLSDGDLKVKFKDDIQSFKDCPKKVKKTSSSTKISPKGSENQDQASPKSRKKKSVNLT